MPPTSALTVNLTVRGLFALIPTEPIRFDDLDGTGQVLSGLKVLVPDARQGATVGPWTVCPHHANLTIEQPHGAARRIDLGGDTIEISGTGTNAAEAKLVVEPSVASITRMDLAAPDTRRFGLSPANVPLVASLAPATGTVSAGETTRLLEFRAGEKIPGTYRDRFASVIRIAIELDGATGLLQITPFAGGAATTVSLQPKPGRSAVDITLENLCDPAQAPHGNEPDEDFAINYRFFPGYEGPFFIPFPVHGSPHAGEVLGEATRPGGCVGTIINNP